MRKFLFALSFSSILLTSFSQTRPVIDFENYNPPSSLVVPGKVVAKAKYPFIDIHNHQQGMDAQKISALVKVMDTLNMAVMINLSGSNGESLKKSIDAIKATAPNRFIVFANINFNGVGEEGWTE